MQIHYNFLKSKVHSALFVDELKNSGFTKICIFGAGVLGSGAGYSILTQEINLSIDCFCDNDSKKWGKSFTEQNIICISIEELKAIKNNVICFVINEKHIIEIVKQLKNIGIAHIIPIEINELREYNTKIIGGDVILGYDRDYLANDVPLSKIAHHKKWVNYVAEFGNKKGMKVLEIGSRFVTGDYYKAFFPEADYIGFDFYPGKNVDVVGDAHKLSTYFPNGEKFDVIYSSAVFEHFAMPWLVAIEISKLLKVGGLLYVETHFSFSSHERPWHFFQYSDMALKVLFSPSIGFECIEAGMCNPMVGRFSSLADDYLKNKPITGLYCHSNYLGKKIKDVENFCWEKIDLNEVVEDTKYPEPK